METKQYETPFRHWVIDSFITTNYARQLSLTVLNQSGPWVYYDNDCEKKRALNEFHDDTLSQFFRYLGSSTFINRLELMTGITGLSYDPFLHGGGIHVTDPGGFLQRHVDYAIHPRSKKERRLNLIVFLSDWKPGDGAELDLYDGKELSDSITPMAGRAALWEPTECQGEPLRFHGTARNTGDSARITAACYYTCQPRPGTPARYEALFAPNRGKV